MNLKRDNRLKLIDIIEYVDYNAPIDGKDVIYIKIPNPAPNAKKTVKAFRVFGHVFIVPERYLFNTYYTKNLAQPDNPKTGALYDPNYLATNDTKSAFLKKITLLLKRIAYTNTGQSLLRALTNGLPLKDFKGNYQQEVFDSCSSVELVDPQGNPINKRIACSLIIYGPTANCIKNKTVWIIDEKNTALTKNGHGTLAEIIFNPDLFHAFTTIDPLYSNCIPSQKTFVQDPAISLFHEMVHALHINYGSAMNEGLPITKRNSSIAADELTIVSKSDQEKIPYNIIKNYDTNLKENLNRIVDTLNGLTIASNETKIKTLYKNKYFLDYDPVSKRYSSTKGEFDKLKELIRYSIYEENISKELNILARKSYLDPIEPSIFRANILDEKIYTRDKGFNINGGYSGQKTDNTKLIRENSVISTLVKICMPRLKRNISTANLCIEIDSDQMISIVNDDYSDYKIVYTIDDQPIDPANIEENRQLYFPKTDEPIKILLPDTQVEKINLKSEEWATKQFPETENIKLSKSSRYHILKAQQYDTTLDPKKDRIQFIEADGKEETIALSIQDNKKFYSYFPKSNKLINRIESFASAYLYAQWTIDLINNIKEESTKEKIKKIGEDIIQIVPYLGAAYNVGKDITEGEFIKAFIDAGIGMLLLFSPKTIIPLALYDITTKIVQSKNPNTTDADNNLKLIRNTINNAFTMRETYLKSYTTEMLHMWWGHIYLEVEDMIYNLKLQLDNYKQNMLHNIDYHGLKTLDADKKATPKLINYYKDNFERQLDIHIEKALKNAATMLAISAKKHLKEKWNTNIIEKLKAYDNEVALKLTTFIDTNAKGISNEIISTMKGIVKKTFNQSGLNQILNDKEINNNINQIITNYNPFVTQLKINQGKILCKIEVIINEESKITDVIDTTGQTEVTGSENIHYLQITNGRQLQTSNGKPTGCMVFEKDHYIQLEDNKLLSKTSLNTDFTWSFWIRYPINQTDEKQTIIAFTDKDDHTSGFEFFLSMGFIYFRINTLDQDHNFKPHNIFGGSIEDNKWHMITASYNSTDQDISIYKDASLIEKKTIANLYKKNYNANFTIGIIDPKNPGFVFKLEQFKAYNAYFTEEDILALYEDNMGKYLYDHWGEPLKYNTKYYINHIPLEGHKSEKFQPYENSPYYFVKNIKKETFKPTPHSDPCPLLNKGESIIFKTASGISESEETQILNRSLTIMEMDDLSLYSNHSQYNYIISEKEDNNKRSKIFQLHALRQEILRTVHPFNPYSIVITGTTSEGYNAGAFLNIYWYNKIFYTIDTGFFQVNKNALAQPGKTPFISTIDDEKDNFINRFCWTFIPVDEEDYE